MFQGKLFHHHIIGIVFFIFVVSYAYCGAGADKTSHQETLPNPPSLLTEELIPQVQEAVVLIEEAEPVPVVPSRAESVMKAIADAYPRQIVGPAVFQNGDWTVTVRGELFYYAEGRMLPEHLKDSYAEYDPQPFYRYPEELPPWEPASEEENAVRRASENRRRENPPKRAPLFFDALYRAHSRDESYARVKTLKFLGRNIMVHYNILEQLALVEEEIYRDAVNNAEVRSWIDSIEQIDGWNWRIIADTNSRSFHSYGTALDFIPTSLKGLQTYWLWTAGWHSEWWNIPYTERFHPPEKVVEAFEKYGFIWGGKWGLFDTMHFEYRPEILILNDIEMAEYY